MHAHDIGTPVRGGRMQIPRSRGAASGFLLVVLGALGALIPFVGPYFDFAWGSDQVWSWTSARGWLEVLPGVATVIGGLLLLGSRNRATAMFGGWLTVLAGAWFVVGRSLREAWSIGDVGKPIATTAAKFAALDLAYFSGLGVVIVFLGATALGRLSVRSLRDVKYAHRPGAAPDPVTADAVPQPAPTEKIATPEPTEPQARGWRGLLRRRRPEATTVDR